MAVASGLLRFSEIESIWYNDIEEGFNVSTFEEYGTIKELWCNQSELHWEVRWLWQNTHDRLYGT